MPSVILTIPDEHFAEFKAAFLIINAVPLNPSTGEPTMTDAQWIKEWGRQQYFAAYRYGRRALRDIAHPDSHNPDIIG